MPIYEYECESCHHRIEVMQKINDPPLKKCDRCGKKLKKIISASGIQFKGSGWYVTDYSQKMKSKEDKKPGDGKKKEASASAPDASSKPNSAPKSDSPAKKEPSSKS